MAMDQPLWRAINIKADLLGAAPIYLDFLEKWASYNSLASEQSLKRIVYRYESLWLPLVSEWFQTDLEPPLDVYWVWHLHMLHPKLYVDYCMSRFGRLLPHKIRLSDVEEKHARSRTKLIWKDKYPSEVFDLDLDVINPGTYDLNGSKLGILLHNAVKSMQFFHQVSLPHFRDMNFLSSALDRYKQFLALKKIRPYSRTAPPIDILFMWRLHALHPLQYHTEALRPYRLYSLAENVDFDGRCLLDYGYNDADWNANYRGHLLVGGSAYRGTPQSHSSIQPLHWHNANPTTDKCHIALDEISVSDVWSRDKKLNVVVRLLGKSSFSGKEILKYETSANKVNRSANSSSGEGLTSFNFDSKDNRGIEFNISAIRGACSCARGEVHLTTMLFNPREPFEKSSFTTKDFIYQIPKVSHIDPQISFRCRVKAEPPQPHILSLERKPMKPGPLPNEIIPFVKDLPKWREAIAKESPGENGLEFVSAKHRLNDRENISNFGVEIIKQNDFDLGAILVHHDNNRLVAVAHTIGDETLASPIQLTSKCPINLDPDNDEMAMLISNNKGQWAVCKASWESPNDEGRVKFTVFFLQSHTDLTFYVRDDEMQTIIFGDVTIDMPTGRISMDSRNSEVAENITLAFSVGVMYVSCQVRASILIASRSTTALATAGMNGSVRSTKSSSTLDLEASVNSNKGATTPKFNVRRRNKKHTKRRKMSASFTFLLATGLQIDVTLHGSTGRNQRPVSRGSLGSIHLLYERTQSTESHSPQTYFTDARNNNTAYVNNGSVRSQASSYTQSHQSFRMTKNGIAKGSNGSARGSPASSTTGYHHSTPNNASTQSNNKQPAPPAPKKKGDSDLYMDIRL